MKKAVGKVIKAFREHLNYKQEFVAKKLNVTVATLANIENGRVSIDIMKLHKLSIIFKVPLRDIVTLASEIFEKGSDEGLRFAVAYMRNDVSDTDLELAC
ncbi:helix-turn-helix transcriptional regulator [Pedobacter sp.]